MLNKILIGLGIGIIPFFTIPNQVDTRHPKFMLSILFAISLSLWVFYKGEFKPFKNRWVLFFLMYLGIHIILAPAPVIMLGNTAIGNFWLWKPLFSIFVFSIMFLAVSSYSFSREEISLFLNIMVWAGFIMALYVFMQGLGLDQFYKIKENPTFSLPPSAKMGGTLGHPTLVSPFIAMIIPIALYFKRYVKAGAMAAAVLLTQSYVAIGAMLLSMAFLLAVRGRKWLVSIGIGVMIAGLVLSVGMARSAKVRAFVGDNGRFVNWKQVIQDIRSPLGDESGRTYPFTGIGLGSFYYIYHTKHPVKTDNYYQAHNDYLELLYNSGIIGLFMFLGAIWYMFKINFPLKSILAGNADKYRMTLLSSFLCIAICAGGTFVWQLGPHILYTIIFAGLLHNQGGL